MITICQPCGITENEDVEHHLASSHPGEMFEIDVDPAANLSVIRRRVSVPRPNPTRVTQGHLAHSRGDVLFQIALVIVAAWAVAVVVLGVL